MQQVADVLEKPSGDDATGHTAESLRVIVEGNLEVIAAGSKAPMIEAVSLKGFQGFCDEEPKLAGKPVNVSGTATARRFGFPTHDVLYGE